MKAFRVTGKFLMGRNTQHFTIETASANEAEATEYIYSILGSRHRANRKSIEISDITEMTKDEVTDLTVQQVVWGKE